MRLHFQDDGTLHLRTGKVELGQGIRTALAQIAADELGLAPDQVQVLAADTAFGPDEGMTSGSLSVQDAGAALRQACRDCARDSGRTPSKAMAPRAVGQSLPRSDLPAKLRGESGFIHDLQFEGLRHGRVLHPPRWDGRLAQADLAPAQACPGVQQVLRDGQLLGLIAHSSAAADQGLALLQAGTRWQADEPALTELAQFAAHHPPSQWPWVETQLISQQARPSNGQIARTLSARYRKPWIAHASLAPSIALARWDDGTLHVICHSQGIFALRRDLALAFGIGAGQVRVQHADGAGCYGHNGADDVAFDAAWLARQTPGQWLRLLWQRADEMTQSPLGPAMEVEVQADLDAAGGVLHWRQTVWSPGHSSRPGRSATPALLGAWQVAQPFARPEPINMPPGAGGGADRNGMPGYALAAWCVTSHRVRAPWRSSALRALGAVANVFAAESFVDELAQASGQDPLAWREQHLGADARGLAVLQAAAELGAWASRTRGEGIGHGLGFARYKGTGAWCAVLAEVRLGRHVQVQRLSIAVDVGLAINAGGVQAQIEGGALQACSWALLEAVAFAGARVASAGFGSYPVLRFADVPAMQVHLMPSQAPSLGAGEAALGPTVAAIANAVADALGLRVRELPFTPERIAAAIHAAPA